MKTEDLSWEEAIKAYANGERVRSNFGGEYWIENGIPDDNNNKIAETPWFPTPDHAPFSIVKPEPKRLTFDEALSITGEGKIIKIETPTETTWMGGNHLWDLSLLDLAERKGWPITVDE